MDSDNRTKCAIGKTSSAFILLLFTFLRLHFTKENTSKVSSVIENKQFKTAIEQVQELAEISRSALLSW